MSKLENLTGKTFGRLTVIERADDYVLPSGRKEVRWLCECSCEEHNRILALANNLKRGKTRSCGCIGKEKITARNLENRKTNIYNLNGEFGIGITSNTNEEFYFDLEDYEKIKNYCWYVRIPNGTKKNRRKYRCLETYINNKPVRFTELIGCKWHDHIDRNPLNNKKENLRPCTQNTNSKNHSVYSTNKSGVSGVCYTHNKYLAYIYVNSKQINLGSFTKKEDAIVTRLKAEKKYFGEFAPQRHLFEKYDI